MVGGAGVIGAVGTELLLQPILRSKQRTVKKRTMPERRARTSLILKRSDVRVVEVARLENYWRSACPLLTGGLLEYEQATQFGNSSPDQRNVVL